MRTTPEAIDLQRTFKEMLDKSDVAAVMEVSSHALELHRADAIHFAAAIFTNLTQDHLDFHPTMEDYFHAKRKLFSELEPRHSIINIDDPYGARLAAEIGPRRPITFALDDATATYRATNIDMTLTGSTFTARPRTAPIDAHLAAQRALQRLQRPRRVRRRPSARRPSRNSSASNTNSRQGPRPLRGRRRGPGLRRNRRLRAHARQPGERPQRRPRAHRQSASSSSSAPAATGTKPSGR